MLETNEYITLIKNYLTEINIDYTIVNETFHGPFWSLRIRIKEYDITISGDIGFDVKVKANHEELPLWKIDRSLIDFGKTSPENIKRQLDVLAILVSR